MLPDSKSLGPSLPAQIPADTEITHLPMQGRPVGRLVLPSQLRSRLLIAARRGCPQGWGSRPQEDIWSLPLDAKPPGQPSATRSIQKTAHGVSVFPGGTDLPK